MSELERWTLNGLALNDDTFTLEAISDPPAPKKPEWVSGADSDGAVLAREPKHDNGVIEMTIRVVQQDDMDAALTKFAMVLDQLQECERNENGLPLVWAPADCGFAPITWRALLGEVVGLPKDWQESGWFVRSPLFQIRITRLPFGEGVEYHNVSVDDDPVTALESYGHSYVSGYGVEPYEAFMPQVAAGYGVSGEQSATVGGVLIEQLINFFESDGLQRTTGTAPRLGIVMMGVNDAGMWLSSYAAGLFIAFVSLVSRMRVAVGDAFAYTDGSVTLGAGWTAAGYLTYRTTNTTFTIDVSGYPAGGVVGVVLPSSQATGAVHTFTVDGGAAGSLDTRTLYPTSPASLGIFCPWVARVVIPPASTTLSIAITSVVGLTAFYGWHMESNDPPVTVLVKQPDTPLPLSMATVNTAIDNTVAAFGDDHVVAVDPDAAIGADPDLFLADLLHLTAAGHRIVADEVVSAIDANAHTSSGVTSTDPIVTLEVADVGGDVPGRVRIVATDAASKDRRYMPVGIESRWYDPSASLVIDSTSMVTAGYAGTTATRSGAYSGGSNNVIGATLRTQVQAICGLPNLAHVGAFRPMLRFYASATTIAVRLTYQALDGPMRSLSYRAPVVAGWNCVDLGLITIPQATAGAQRWTGRIEAYSTAIGGETFQADVVLLMPAEQFGRARGVYAHTSGVLTAIEDGAGASGTLLGARTAPVGGAWTTSGAATDWEFATVTSGAFTGVDMYRQTVSDASARLGFIGSSVTNSEVGADIYFSNTGASWEWGVMARYSAATDYLRATLYATTTGSNVTAELRVTKRVGGSDTVLGSQALPGTLGQGDGTPSGAIYPIRLVAFASGRCIAIVTDRAGAVLARVDVTDTALATGGALATGKGGVYDRNLGASGIFRAMDNFYSATPAAEPIVCYAGRSIEFSSDGVLREDATGTYSGRPPEYVGGRFLIPCSGAAARKTRIAVIAKRFDVQEVGDDYIADSLTVQAYVTERFLAVPRA